MLRLTRQDLNTAACGLMMGAADIVPGVSGGTVALVLGIYQRLVTAISHFDTTTLWMLKERRWQMAASRVDLRFLIALGTGVATGIGGLAFVMHELLTHHLQLTYAAFFGLILGSGVLVARSISRWNGLAVVATVTGSVAAWNIVGLNALQTPPDGMWYLYLCGAVGICAMILPGISGAFILLILGKYADITGMLRDLLRGDATLLTVTSIAVFSIGCASGLLAFSRLLKWLLARHGEITLALLCGFMLGSLRRIWPFKIDLSPEIMNQSLKQYANTWPEALDRMSVLTVCIAVAATLSVLLLDLIARRREALSGSAPDSIAS